MHALRRFGVSSIRSHSTNVNTVNASEVALFSRLSSLWWDERGEFIMLHKLNPPRMEFIRQKLSETLMDEGLDEGNAVNGRTITHPLRGLDVLDVGCGGGLFSERLARAGANATGIDASESNVSIASIHAAKDPQLSGINARWGSLKYIHTTAEALVKEQKRFDVVCSMEVIEHVDNPADFLRVCADLVKPGGHMFMSTMSRTPVAYLLTIFAAEQVLRFVTAGTHTYSKYIKPSEMVSYFQNHLTDSGKPWITGLYDGLPSRIEADVRGVIYVPWEGQWRLSRRAGSSLESDINTMSNYIFWVRKPKE